MALAVVGGGRRLRGGGLRGVARTGIWKQRVLVCLVGREGLGMGRGPFLFLLVWAETLRFILISHVKYLMKRGVKLAGAEAVSGSMYCTVQVLNKLFGYR